MVDIHYVLAVLQAARAEALGLDRDAARSWGLNRAIFYTALRKGYINRRGSKSRRAHPPTEEELRERALMRKRLYSVGGEKAYRAPGLPRGKLRFMIGGRVQRPEDFVRQVIKRFPEWDRVWREAQELVASVPRSVLMKAGAFHDAVFKRHRDELAQRWSMRLENRPQLRVIQGGRAVTPSATRERPISEPSSAGRGRRLARA